MTGPSPTQALKALLDAMPGAVAEAKFIGRATEPAIVIYKIMNKMFAILSIRGTQNVILKCDPHLAQTLRSAYAGVGHRSHLDRRFWISVDLDADVPAKEIEKMVSHSYDQVRAGLTKQQQDTLAALRR
jgi:predicted DNA-binding protein (MmcQ/YjbR family)